MATVGVKLNVDVEQELKDYVKEKTRNVTNEINEFGNEVAEEIGQIPGQIKDVLNVPIIPKVGEVVKTVAVAAAIPFQAVNAYNNIKGQIERGVSFNVGMPIGSIDVGIRPLELPSIPINPQEIVDNVNNSLNNFTDDIIDEIPTVDELVPIGDIPTIEDVNAKVGEISLQVEGINPARSIQNIAYQVDNEMKKVLNDNVKKIQSDLEGGLLESDPFLL